MIEHFKNLVKEKSDNELVDIYLNSSGYQEEFMESVLIEIRNRNIPIETLQELKIKKSEIDKETLKLGKQGSQFWMVVAFIISILGGVVGIIAGYQYYYSKHKSIDGEEYYYYNESTRKYGKWMMIIGCIVLGLTILYILNGY